MADSPATKASIIFLIPVAATSSATPMPRIVAPNAAIDPEAKPPTSPNGPIRCTISMMPLAAAGVLLPR